MHTVKQLSGRGNPVRNPRREILGKREKSRGGKFQGKSPGAILYTGMHTLNQIPRGIPGENHKGLSFSLYQHEQSQANSWAEWEKSQGGVPLSVYQHAHSQANPRGEILRRNPGAISYLYKYQGESRGGEILGGFCSICQHAHSQATLGERESREKSQERNPGEEGEIPGGEIPGEISGSYPLYRHAHSQSNPEGNPRGESQGAILLSIPA
jgi:hypothetical protein